MQIKDASILRLQRNVEMYQWKEHQHEHKTKKEDGTEVTTYSYTYSQDWFSSPQCIGHDSSKANPGLPGGLDWGKHIFEAQTLEMGGDNLVVPSTLVHQLDQFTPLPLNKGIAKPESAGFVRSTEENVVVNRGADLNSPKVGDVRVAYAYIPRGTCTVVTKVAGNTFEPFAGKLKKKLSSEEIKIDPMATQLAKDAGFDTFIIPPWIISAVEDMLMAAAPLQVHWMGQGAHDFDAAFGEIAKDDEGTTNIFRAVGTVGVVIAAQLTCAPLAVVGRVREGAAIVTGLGIAYNTINTAKIDSDDGRGGRGGSADVEL